ncbi:hypothetical protein FIU97_06090 [Roseivivax sp. THAF40]|uniref:methyltransferase family protein n=1 Tax=unclassified Roseivivax TaxID=2639302 RepID=UPI001267AB3C|nr:MULTISPECIES: isoprenylcysteine carboxylmethyltransferase family protein [unclassified Roseivivax]QFS82371.1 hypothetical protein FIV09_05985 [Roseivivax sp. THAF197b]QFT46141.1 hypothetical protein FIU97_06090 [Roseivivax sp. THAF40]
MKWIDMPPVWLLGALILARIGAGIGPLPALQFSGTIFVAMGLIMILLAAWEFRRARTTIIPRQAPSAIIRTGIFAKTRNPIYLGDALILLGAALYWGSILGLVLVPVFMMLINKRFIEKEEALLRSTFLAEFDTYAQQVRRWL